MTAAGSGRLYGGADWDFCTIQRIYDACEDIARSELELEFIRIRSR